MYQQASYETGVKPGAIRMAAVRLGQTKNTPFSQLHVHAKAGRGTCYGLCSACAPGYNHYGSRSVGR